MSFNFTNPPKTATGFTLPTASTPTTAASLGGFPSNPGAGGDSKSLLQTKPVTNLFGSGTSAAPVAGLTFGKPAIATPSLNFGTPPTSATTAPTLTLGTPVGTATLPQFGAVSTSISAPSTTSTTAFTPIVGTSTASTGGGLTLGSVAPPASATTPKLSFTTPAATATAATSVPAPTLTLGTAPTTLASLPPTNVTTTTSTIPATGTLTFAQLEDSINKWTIDLEEQGKFFINQAKQLNAWDTLLISNGEKILNLNNSIERVKQQQTQLDQELDFVLAQQKELEELIKPLERELVEIPVTDIDRNQMYQFSEIIDSQLKQMSEDLKEIIEHINESNKDEENANPITQISRILNAHMNSLQWIDRNTAQISSHLEQISQMQDTNRRNTSFNQSFNI